MFTLNMLFDLTNDKGLFSDPKSTNHVEMSYTWWKHEDPDPYGTGLFDPRVFNPEQVAPLRTFSSKGTLYIPSKRDKHRMLLRIAAVSGPGDAKAPAEIVVCFGRAVKAQQVYASPFRDRSGQTTTFFHQDEPRDALLTGWILDMGTIANVPADEDENLVHRYEFSVGAKITDNGTIRYYGEDPEFDIGL